VASSLLNRFSPEEAATVSNRLIGRKQSGEVSEAHHWLCDHPENLDIACLAEQIQQWSAMTPYQAGDLMHLLHLCAPNQLLKEIAADAALYAAPGPTFARTSYKSLAVVAASGLTTRFRRQSEMAETKKEETPQDLSGPDAACLQIMRTLARRDYASEQGTQAVVRLLVERSRFPPPQDPIVRREFAAFAKKFPVKPGKNQEAAKPLAVIQRWAAQT